MADPTIDPSGPDGAHFDADDFTGGDALTHSLVDRTSCVALAAAPPHGE